MRNGKYTTILIDDESWTRDVLRYIGKWDELGIEIIAEASDGEYGLELVVSLNPDIIISDVKMPNMSGLTLIDTLRKRDCHAKVIFVSGYDDFQFVRNAVQLQATDYLLKPVKPEELNAQLERCVKELSQEQGSDSTKDLSLQGVLHVSWFTEYTDLRTSIYESLKANNLDLLQNRIESLEALVIRSEGDSPSKNIAIYIHFDFHNMLQKFISECGYSFNEIMDEKAGSYVFSSNFSFHEMIQSIRALFVKAIMKMEHLKKEKNKIDIKLICKYIESNYAENISLEKTAENFYISKEYLSKVLKSETGAGFSGYITGLRMKKAKELLLMDVAIKEIAEMTGYKELGHFYKVFKKYYGITPGEMLNNIRNQG